VKVRDKSDANASNIANRFNVPVHVSRGLIARVSATLLIALCWRFASAQGVSKQATISAYASILTSSSTNGGDDNGAVSVQLSTPSGIAYDSAGNTYFANYGTNQIVVRNSSGVLSVLAGTGGACTTIISGADTACGDGGAASAATLNGPTAIQFDSSGNLYIADYGDNRIRKIKATGGIVTSSSTIVTIAGTGTSGVSGTGAAATVANLNGPHGLALDSSDNLFITEQGGCVIQYLPAVTHTVVIGGVSTSVTAGKY